MSLELGSFKFLGFIMLTPRNSKTVVGVMFFDASRMHHYTLCSKLTD